MTETDFVPTVTESWNSTADKRLTGMVMSPCMGRGRTRNDLVLG